MFGVICSRMHCTNRRSAVLSAGSTVDHASSRLVTSRHLGNLCHNGVPAASLQRNHAGPWWQLLADDRQKPELPNLKALRTDQSLVLPRARVLYLLLATIPLPCTPSHCLKVRPRRGQTERLSQAHKLVFSSQTATIRRALHCL